MPSDHTNPINPPPLCKHHGVVIRNLAEKDHVDDRDSERVARSISGQCCNQGRDLR